MTETPTVPVPGKPGKLAQISGAVVLGVILWGGIKIGGWIFSDPVKPEKVEDLSRHIVKVETVNVLDKGVRLQITHFQKNILSEKSFVSSASFDAVRINRGIVENWPDKYYEVLYFFRVPSTDQYGQTGDALAFKVRWDAADLRRIKWENFTAWGMLSLARDVQFNPIGRRAVAEYCSDDDNLKYAMEFCRRLLM